MSDSGSLCYILVLAVSVALVIYGFMLLLQKQHAGENDVQVLQRQLRGIAYLMLSQLVLVLGMSLCVGMNMDSVARAVRVAGL